MRTLAVVLAVLAVAPSAAARSIATIPLAGSGSVDEEDLFQAGETVAATLRERGHDVLGPVETTDRFEERAPGCIASAQQDCWTRTATALARDTVVHGRVTRDSTSAMATVTLIALDARDGRVLVETTHQGAAVERPALVALVRVAAAHLSDELPALQRHPRLRVETQPSGADLLVNGNPVGRTPWSAEIAEGACVVEARAAGFRRALREITLAEGQSRTLTILLQRGDDDGGDSQRASWQLPAGIGGIALGTLGIVFGATQLLRDECLETYPDGFCRRQITAGERVGFGVVPLVLGLATATAGVLVGFVFELGEGPSQD